MILKTSRFSDSGMAGFENIGMEGLKGCGMMTDFLTQHDVSAAATSVSQGAAEGFRQSLHTSETTSCKLRAPATLPITADILPFPATADILPIMTTVDILPITTTADISPKQNGIPTTVLPPIPTTADTLPTPTIIFPEAEWNTLGVFNYFLHDIHNGDKAKNVMQQMVDDATYIKALRTQLVVMGQVAVLREDAIMAYPAPTIACKNEAGMTVVTCKSGLLPRVDFVSMGWDPKPHE